MRPPSIGATTVTLALAGAIVSASTRAAPPVAPTAPDRSSLSATAAANEAIATYCVSCHNERRRSGGVSLAQFDVSQASADLDVAERAARRLRAGMMPPAGAARPEADARTALAATIEQSIDTAAAAAPPEPGSRPFQRLNRAEYAQAIRDLVGIEIDPGALLPPDTISSGFDNVADVQTFSPTLVTSYLQAARQISGQATNDVNRLVFACRPRNAADESACATRIISGLVARAYRGTGTADDLRDAMTFYERGRATGDFRGGIRLALQSILMSPRFLFRLESRKPTTSGTVQPIDDVALASRLSFFLWGRAPDARLLSDAKQGLHQPAVYRSAIQRMLADTRSSALASRFARQWLRLQDLESVKPDPSLFPQFDAALAASMLRETELFFDSIVRGDRSVLDLLTADYSFVDARLAKHYGLPPVPNAGFSRVAVPESRRGLLGQGSILTATSLAGRTSPVLRGKWVMEVLLNTPPPPPPPNVPALDDSATAVRNGVRFSTRQRIEQHRKSPQCSSCHRVIDPLGVALENFDVTGAWRDSEDGVAVDARGDLFDGTAMEGPAGLRRALLERKELFLRTFTENLLTYALGRRLTVRDMTLVRAIVSGASENNYRFSSFVMGVATSAPFTMTSEAPPPPTRQPAPPR